MLVLVDVVIDDVLLFVDWFDDVYVLIMFLIVVNDWSFVWCWWVMIGVGGLVVVGVVVVMLLLVLLMLLMMGLMFCFVEMFVGVYCVVVFVDGMWIEMNGGIWIGIDEGINCLVLLEKGEVVFCVMYDVVYLFVV